MLMEPFWCEYRAVVAWFEAGMAGGTLQEFSELLGGIAQVDDPAAKARAGSKAHDGVYPKGRP